MKTYHGYRQMHQGTEGMPVPLKCVVTVNVNGRQRPLRPRNDIRDHSPTGFEWGYGGSGPAQLALALVADCCGRADAIPTIYQRVKMIIVARLPHDGWTISEEDVLQAVEQARAQMREAEGDRQAAEGGGQS